MAYASGSEWRKWDLHVHTPKSHTAQYGSDETAWARFVADLRALPDELSVIGINDYIWVDGYEVVVGAHGDGALPNIEVLFPVIELRLDDFIGTDGKLSKLNAHVIFSPGTDPERIKQQFIPRLVTGFKLTDRYQDLETRWSAIPTRDAFTEPRALIKSTVPPQELPHYGSDFLEGFNNWVIPLACVKDALDDSSFPERPLLALGKTEWEDIPWNNNTIAAKKRLISSVDLLFTASPSPSACTASVERLRTAAVNHRVLDCSDAHHFRNSNEKDRIGNCFTWICADPTLAGLKHALLEYESRVFIGDTPPLLVRRKTDPTHFISRADIRPAIEGTTPPPSFDVTIPINSGFVAIVGNKGSGKSALLDSISLAGNSSAEAQFTFLSDNRFRNPRNNRALHYQVELEIADGEHVGPVLLSSAVDTDAPERLRYLPQSLLETLCNKEPGSPDDAFEGELRSIIFSHVPEHQRLGCQSLDDLIHQRGEALDREIEHRRVELAEVSRTISGLEERARPSRIKKLRATLSAVDRQLANHERARPPDPVAPEPDTEPEAIAAAGQLNDVRDELEKLLAAEGTYQASYATERARLDASDNLSREIEILRSIFAAFDERADPLALQAGVTLASMVRLEIDTAPLEAARAEAAARLASLDEDLAPDGSVAASRVALLESEAALEGALDMPRRRFEQQRRELEAWSIARKALVGTPTEGGTHDYLVAELDEAEHLADRLLDLRKRRLTISEAIHSALLSKVELYRELYGPVQRFLESNELARTHFSLEFEAELEMTNFAERFLSFIDRGISGTFYGVESSAARVQRRVRLTLPQSWASVAEFLTAHDLDLRLDRRTSDTGTALDCASELLRKGVHLAEVYDYLFGLSYLQEQYELRSDGRPISELSPGQKGTILLMFYLLVDQSGRPIALDQPDENLDSHTIHTLLRPAIRAAKATRQILVVTHSPNLAVVGDADQVIVASCDGAKFAYVSGSIENPTIRDLVVKVLEGTWPAFDDRLRKYLTSERSESEGDALK